MDDTPATEADLLGQPTEHDIRYEEDGSYTVRRRTVGDWETIDSFESWDDAAAKLETLGVIAEAVAEVTEDLDAEEAEAVEEAVEEVVEAVEEEIIEAVEEVVEAVAADADEKVAEAVAEVTEDLDAEEAEAVEEAVIDVVEDVVDDIAPLDVHWYKKQRFGDR